MVTRKLKELGENYTELYGSYRQLSRNNNNKKKDIGTMNKNEE